MKAVVYEEYGPPEVLRIKEVAKPIPKENEILIKVYAANVNYGDLRARNFGNLTSRDFNMPMFFLFMARLVFGFNKPKKKILGNEFAGIVEEVGINTKRFKVGDKVFGCRSMNMGAYAEYLCTPEDGIVTTRPENISFEEAAAIPYGAITAMELLKKLKLGNDSLSSIEKKKILIIGASGGIGSAALQLVKNMGVEVTGVCSTQKVGLVKAIGADKVIDYKNEDYTLSGEHYDFIIDILGKGSFSACKKILKPNGCYVNVSFKMKKIVEMLISKFFGNKKSICVLMAEKVENLISLKRLIEEGKFKSIIDRSFPLEQTADAHRYAESGEQSGSVVIKITQVDRLNNMVA